MKTTIDTSHYVALCELAEIGQIYMQYRRLTKFAPREGASIDVLNARAESIEAVQEALEIAVDEYLS